MKHPLVILLALAAFVPVAEFASTTAYKSEGFVWHIIFSLLCTLVVASLVLNNGLASTMMGWRPLIFVGKISYGIYLIHFIALSARMGSSGRCLTARFDPLGFVLMLALSILGSYALAVQIERPCIRLGRRLSQHIRNRPLQLSRDFRRKILASAGRFAPVATCPLARGPNSDAFQRHLQMPMFVTFYLENASFVDRGASDK